MNDEPEPGRSRSPVSGLSAPTARTAVESACRLACDIVENEDRLPERIAANPAALAELTGVRIGVRGHPYDEVVEALRGLMLATPSSASRRFDNQLFGGRDPVATLAEMLTPIVNSSMYTYKVAGPQVLAEQEVLARLSRCIGYSNGEGAFTPGGSIGNLVAMTVARNEKRPELRDHGMGSARLTAYTSEHSHYSIRKNAGILGIGRYNVRFVPVDGCGRMQVEALVELVRRDREAGHEPFFVNATSGTTVLGAFDPLQDIGEVCRRHRLWFHVDGALGGSLLLSKRHRHLLDGGNAADSFLWNAHKMMGVPLSCSALLLRRQGLLARSFDEVADYLFQTDTNTLNPGTRSMQCGRRNDALKLWAAWVFHGDIGYESRLDHLLDLAQHAARRISDDPDLRLCHNPESVNVCFEVLGVPSDEICTRLDRRAQLKIGHADVFGTQAIRLVCINPDFGTDDIDRMLRDVKKAASDISGA